MRGAASACRRCAPDVRPRVRGFARIRALMYGRAASWWSRATILRFAMRPLSFQPQSPVADASGARVGENIDTVMHSIAPDRSSSSLFWRASRPPVFNFPRS